MKSLRLRTPARKLLSYSAATSFAKPLLAILMALGASHTHAATYNWNSLLGGFWSNSTSTGWNTGTTEVPGPVPNAIDDVVNFTQNITANRFITVDGDYTIGTLLLQDTGGSLFHWVLRRDPNNVTVGNLLFEVSSGNANLNVRSSGNNATTLTVPVQLKSNLNLDVGAASSGITFTGGISGTGLSIVKTGTQTATFGAGAYTFGQLSVEAGTAAVTAAAENFSADVTINGGGTLLASGALSGSAVQVNNGTLGGSGGIITNLVKVGDGTGINDAILSPGAGIGMLNAGAVTFASDGVFALEINSDTTIADLLNSAGVVTLSLATLTASDLGFTMLEGNHTFTFLTAASIVGEFAGLPDGTLLTVGNNSYAIDYTATTVSLVSIPEPGATASLVGGVGLLMGMRRRRR